MFLFGGYPVIGGQCAERSAEIAGGVRYRQAGKPSWEQSFLPLERGERAVTRLPADGKTPRLGATPGEGIQRDEPPEQTPQ